MDLITKRLLLRQWKEEDLLPFAALNADPRVMEYIGLKTREESDAMAHKCRQIIDKQGWGLWAVSAPGVADFIGIIGLHQVAFSAPFTPAIEISWRLTYDFWNKGYALEGAQAALAFGFETLKLDQIVSFTVVENRRSRKLMEKLGMRRNPADDFDHPRVPDGSPLKRHVLYKLKKEEWMP